MEKLDKNIQHRVWDRVYDRQPLLTPQQRKALHACLQRAGASRQIYEKLENHSHYGDAFARMAQQTNEHIKMLRQILGQ